MLICEKVPHRYYLEVAHNLPAVYRMLNQHGAVPSGSQVAKPLKLIHDPIDNLVCCWKYRLALNVHFAKSLDSEIEIFKR